MVAFLLLLNGGYLDRSFTAAGGQTIGKMVAGTRVVSGGPADAARVSFGTAIVRAAACVVSLLPAGAGLLHGALRRRPPRAARRGRRYPRHQSVTRLAVFIATVGYCGYFPIAPGTVGSAAGLLVYLLVWWTQSPLVEVGADRRRLRRRHLGRRPSPSATSAASIPGRSSSTKCSACSITLAFIPVGWSAALAGFVLFRIFDVIKPYPANRLERCTAASA